MEHIPGTPTLVPRLYNLTRLADALAYDRTYVSQMVRTALATAQAGLPAPAHLVPTAYLLYEQRGTRWEPLFTAAQLATAQALGDARRADLTARQIESARAATAAGADR